MSTSAEQKIKGVWWRSDAPEFKLQGEIVYGHGLGATVDLFGHVFKEFDDRKLATRFILHGITHQNKSITLFDCITSNSELYIPGGISCVIQSNFCVVGSHYQDPADINFKKIHVHFNGLKEWTWTSGIQHKYEENPRKAIFTYQVPNDVVLGEFDGLFATLAFTGTTTPGNGSLSIKEECQLTIESQSMKPYEVFEKFFVAFQHFLSLALQRPAYALQIIGNIDVPMQTIKGFDPLYEDFWIIRELSKRTWNEEMLMPQHMLFTLPELGESLQITVRSFFEKRTRLKPSMDLYLSTIYNPDQATRARFLTLAQAIEGYHRVSMPGKYMDDDEYEKGIRKALENAIPDGINSGFRESLKNKLNYLHEYSFRKRIEELAQRHSGIIGKLLGAPKELASSISDLRNQLTHPDPSTLGELDYKKLWHLSDIMALLLEVCFLDELGFEENRIKDIINLRSDRARRVYYGTF